jgi:hypothetical protein
MVNETDNTTLDDESQSPSLSKIPRATSKNPIYGHVEGVKRGNMSIRKCHLFTELHLLRQWLGVVRQHPLPPSLKEAPSSTKRFNRLMLDLIIRVSDHLPALGSYF